MAEGAFGSEFRDVVAIGFGPSGLALAAAFADAVDPPDAVFLERRESFAWHDGMLLEGAHMQVSCLKDLATLRDPRSRFTFLQYLHAVGRLDQFVNLGTLRPSRVEFNEYLRWVSGEVGARVRYGTEVVAVEPVVADGGVAALRVRTRAVGAGVAGDHLTSTVVLSAGAEPRSPAGVDPTGSRRVFHSSEFLHRMAHCFPDRAARARFLVVGDGQSAAEIVDHLGAAYPGADVTAVTRGIGYRPMDETPFVNEIFTPAWVEVFHGLRPARREAVLATLRNTNYGVVDPSLIEQVYRTMYESGFTGHRRVELLPFLDLVAVREGPDTVTVELADLLRERTVHQEADAVVLATGYSVPNPHPLLAGLRGYLATDEGGRYRVGRDYRVASTPEFRPAVYLQGYAEATHGLGETLLSVAAVRAREIAESLRGRTGGACPAAGLNGSGPHGPDEEARRVPAQR